MYSTAPKFAVAMEGEFYLKGPSLHVVFAEAVAYELANAVRLSVPEHGICFPDATSPWFACRRMEHRLSLEVLYQQGIVSNPEIMAEVAAFDIWTCNTDRNLGNLVGLGVRNGGRHLVELSAIDFESAQVLRGDISRFDVTAIDPRRLWPKEALGGICGGFDIPREFAQRMAELSDDAISGAIETVISGLNFPAIPWRDATESLLKHRRDNLAGLLREAWQ